MRSEIIEGLTGGIRDIIIDNLPLNTTCPHCEREIDFDCLIDTRASTPSDRYAWEGMVKLILERVSEYGNDILSRGMGL